MLTFLGSAEENGSCLLAPARNSLLDSASGLEEYLEELGICKSNLLECMSTSMTLSMIEDLSTPGSFRGKIGLDLTRSLQEGLRHEISFIRCLINDF
jgi:hypothetical protein